MCLTLCDPRDHTVHGILQARRLEWGTFPFFRGSSSPGIEPRSPEFLMDSFPAEPPGKPFSSFLFFFFGLNSCQTNNALLSTCFLLNYGVSERTIKSTFLSINCRFVHPSMRPSIHLYHKHETPTVSPTLSRRCFSSISLIFPTREYFSRKIGSSE